MSFVKRIEEFDATRGIPRPADMQSMPAYQAFLRVMSAGVMMLLLTGCGGLSAYLLWLSAGYLEVSTQTKLYFLIAMLACVRSEEHTSELQSLAYLVCRLLLEKKKKYYISY